MRRKFQQSKNTVNVGRCFLKGFFKGLQSFQFWGNHEERSKVFTRVCSIINRITETVLDSSGQIWIQFSEEIGNGQRNCPIHLVGFYFNQDHRLHLDEFFKCQFHYVCMNSTIRWAWYKQNINSAIHWDLILILLIIWIWRSKMVKCTGFVWRNCYCDIIQIILPSFFKNTHCKYSALANPCLSEDRHEHVNERNSVSLLCQIPCIAHTCTVQ